MVKTKYGERWPRFKLLWAKDQAENKTNDAGSQYCYGCVGRAFNMQSYLLQFDGCRRSDGSIKQLVDRPTDREDCL